MSKRRTVVAGGVERFWRANLAILPPEAAKFV
jgi:hypothetical protein